MMFWCAALIVSFQPYAGGQSLISSTNVVYAPQLPTPGVGHDYIHMVNETVNPADGNVSLSINIPVSSGRGLTIPFSIVYSSSNFGVMQRIQQNPYNGSSNGSGNSSFLSSAGWNYTLPMLSYVMAYRQYGSVTNDTGGAPGYCPYASNYVFQAPGSAQRHQLGLSNVYAGLALPAPGTGGNGVGGDQCYGNNSGSGLIANLWGVDQNGQYLGSMPSNLDPRETPSVTVSDADGTIYTFAGATSSSPAPWYLNGAPNSQVSFPTFIEDRNGNEFQVSTNYTPSSCTLGVCSGQGVTITDDLGRAALQTVGFGVSGSTINVAGVANPYTLTWATNTNNYTYPVIQYSQGPSGQPSCAAAGTTQSASYPLVGPGITQLKLPNGQSYSFSYNSNGLLQQITYPSGGYVSYVWGINQESAGFSFIIPQNQEEQTPEYCPTLVDQPAITQRNVSFDGKTIALTQTFKYNSGDIGATGLANCAFTTYTTTITTTDNIANLTYDAVYTYNATYNSPPNEQNECLQYFPGTEKSIVYYKDTNTSGTPLLAVTKGWATPASLTCEMHTLDNGEISGVFNTYEGVGSNGGQFQLLTSKSEYDFGILSGTCASYPTSGPTATPTRENTISYQSLAAQPLFYEPSPGGILTIQDRPSLVSTYMDVNGTLTQVGGASYSYDQTSLSTATGTDHDETNYSSSSTAPRGNATTKIVECFPGCQGTTTTYAYNELGQVTSMIDPCGNATCADIVGTSHTTTYSYTDSYTSGTPPGTTYAYLTTIANPLGQTNSFSYGYNTGELTVSQDENLLQSTYTYNDPFNRLTEAGFPDGGQTNYSYSDLPYNPSASPPTPNVITCKLINGSPSTTCNTATPLPSGWKISLVEADGIGQQVETRFNSDPDGLDFGFTVYEGSGRKHSVTNPYRTTSDSSYGTTTYSYDALGRIVLVTESDGSTVQTSYCGPSTLVIDEVGHWRRSINDGLGRLVEVDEPNSATATVTACPKSGDPIVATTYTYDGLNNLIGVTQGGSRQRTFIYDSLSRLLASCNPETCSGTGTISAQASVATGTITIGCSGSCSGDKMLVEIGGTGTGNLCVTFLADGESVNAIATQVASAINNSTTCSNYAIAAANGAVITLTSKTAGSAGDYSFSASSNGTYTITTSSSTLAQGVAYTYPGGSTTYIYDSNSNLVSKTVPAQNQTGSSTVTLSYCYDSLNRMTSKAYTAQSCPMTTPVATYTYDQTACLGQTSCYNVGHETSMTDPGGSESWSYDKMGRVLTDQRTTNSITKSAIYTYAPYVDGSLYTLQYPSGRTVTYSTGNAERLLSASDTADSIYYATGAHYAPQGALSSLTSNDNIFSTYIYNKRLQPCWSYVTTGTALATSTLCTTADSTPGNMLDLQYNFNLGNGTSGTDNGNVVGIKNNRDTTRNQVFTYDWLNRIATAETTSTDSTSSAHCWSQVFGYDVWANLLTVQPGSSAYNGCTQPSGLTLTMTSKNQISGYTYDASGNLNTIPGTGGASYTYDAENQLTSTAGKTYVYDGEGKRVEKSGSKIYWYGTDGEVLDETDQTGSITNSNFNEYIYFGGDRVARRDSSGDVFYYFTDHLESSRAIAQVPSGQTTATQCYDADFYPFGAERSYTNTCPQNYKFTGKERDSESDLDNFEARYYASTMGRFITPDWAERPTAVPYAAFGDPQSLNLYTYVRNDPVTDADANGHVVAPGGGQTPATDPPAQNPVPCGGDSNPQCLIKANADKAVDAAQTAVQSTQQNAAVQLVKDTVVGGTKEVANTVIDMANTVNRPIDAMLSNFTSFRFGQMSEFQGSTSGEKSAMAGVFVVSFLTGTGEEKSAAKGASIVEEIFSNPKVLEKFLSEAHAGALGDIFRGLGWDVGTLGKGSHAGQGMRALEMNAEGKMTGKAVSWHPGGGHHGPSPYWKVSSPKGGTVRVGPQFP
jgi:RHS repeat-associated protein